MTTPATAALIEAAEELVAWFKKNEPGRLDLFGLGRLEEAAAAARIERPTRRGGLRSSSPKRARPTDPRRLARTSDPESSQIAAVRVAPTVGSRQAQVLDRLRDACGEWVDGSALSTAECGGSEGKRRLRELREEKGWPIECRPHPGSATAWQYRLVEGVGVADAV